VQKRRVILDRQRAERSAINIKTLAYQILYKYMPCQPVRRGFDQLGTAAIISRKERACKEEIAWRDFESTAICVELHPCDDPSTTDPWDYENSRAGNFRCKTVSWIQ